MSESPVKVGMHEAKTNLSKLVKLVTNGRLVILTNGAKAVARLVPYDENDAKPARKLGFYTGQATIPEDFDRMGEDEIADMFHTGS